MTGGGLLAVHAHPDDETLWTGGLLATWAASGRPVTVVTCTRGERGEVIALPGTTSEHLAGLEGDGPALAAHRERELAAAVAALGVRQVFLDQVPSAAARNYEDSGMAWIRPGVAGPAPDSPPTAFSRLPLDEPAARLAALIRDARPAVVATYEPGGGYGHPDHVRAHDVTVRALETLDGTRPELWRAVAPAESLRAARRTLAGSEAARAVVAERGLTLPDPGEDLPSLARADLATREGADQDPAVSRIAVAPVIGRVLEAMRAHATQIQHATYAPAGGVLGYYALSNGVLMPLLDEETYLVSRVSDPGGCPAPPP